MIGRFFAVALVAGAFLLYPTAARAGYEHWTVEDGPFGGRVGALLRTDGGVLLAGTEEGGVFRSFGDGAGWAPGNDGLFFTDLLSFAVSPTAPESLFAGTGGGGVYRSANGGRSWFPVVNGLENGTVWDLRFRTERDRLLAATGGGIYRTDDRGATWDSSSAGLSASAVYTLAPAPSADSIWYAGTGSGVFLSADGGSTWTDRSSGLDYPVITDLEVHPGDPDRVWAATSGGGVYKTENGGLSWSPARGGMGEIYVEALALDPARPDTIRAATRRGVFETFDGGGSWTSRNTGLPDTVAQAIHLAGDTLYVGMYHGGVAASAEPSAGWTARNEGLANRFVTEVALSPHDGGVLWLASYGGLYTSADTGWTWNASGPGVAARDLQTVAVSPAGADTLLAGAFYGGLWRSENGGLSWTASSAGIGSTATVTSVRFRPGDGTTVLAGTYGGPWKSVDGGRSWNLSDTGIGSRNVWGMATSATRPDLVYAGTYGDGLFRSRDFGASWSEVSVMGEKYIRAVAIDPSDTSVVYAGGYYEGGMYKSVNGGASWSRKNTGLTDGNVWCVAVDPLDTSHLAVATGSGVFESWNGAEEWEPLDDGPAPRDTRWILFAGERLVAGVSGGSAPWFEHAEVRVASGAPLPLSGAILRARPNPFNPETSLRLEGSLPSGGWDFRVYDLRGRLVRVLGASPLPDGEEGSRALWDGLDRNGRPAPSGVYFAVVRHQSGARASARLVLVR